MVLESFVVYGLVTGCVFWFLQVFLSVRFMLIGSIVGGFLQRISGFREALYAIFMVFCCSFWQRAAVWFRFHGGMVSGCFWLCFSASYGEGGVPNGFVLFCWVVEGVEGDFVSVLTLFCQLLPWSRLSAICEPSMLLMCLCLLLVKEVFWGVQPLNFVGCSVVFGNDMFGRLRCFGSVFEEGWTFSWQVRWALVLGVCVCFSVLEL